MLRITKQHAWVIYKSGEKVLFKKNPTFVDVLWVENYNLTTKASGVVESERSNVTGWLVRPVGSLSNRYVVSDEEIRKRYKPHANEDRLQKYGEDYFWEVAKHVRVDIRLSATTTTSSVRHTGCCVPRPLGRE